MQNRLQSISSFQFNFSSTLSFYIIKNYIIWFFYLLIAFFALIEIFEVKDVLRIANKYPDLTFLRMLSISSLKIPYIVDKIFPFIVFFAAMFSLIKMNRAKELIFCQSAGMSLFNIISPYIIGTILIQVFYMGFYNPVASVMFEKHLKLERIYYQSRFSQMSFLDDNIWMMRSGVGGKTDEQYFIRVKSIDTDKKALSDVDIIVIDKDKSYKATIYAKKALLINDKDINNSGNLELKDVTFAKLHEVEQRIPKMRVPVIINMENIKDVIMPPEAINFWQLQSYGQKLERSGITGAAYKARYHRILSLLLLNIAFVILAAWATIRNVRFSSQLSFIAISIVIAFAIFTFNNMTAALGSSGDNSYTFIITIWIPSLLSVLIAWNMLLKLEESY